MKAKDVRFWVCIALAWLDIVLGFVGPLELRGLFLASAGCFVVGALANYFNGVEDP